MHKRRIVSFCLNKPAIRGLAFALIISALGAGIAISATSPWPFKSNAAPPQLSVSGGLTVAFWNIQWFPGTRVEPDKDSERRQTASVHADISRLNADIIGMEEVRNWEAAALAVQPLQGMKVDVCANFPPREGQPYAQEVAIASRLQPISAWVEMWKDAGASTPPRGFAFAAYEVKPKQLLLVYCVHLKSNRDGVSENIPIREESAKQLLSHIEAMHRAYEPLGKVACIVGGDFNTSLDDSRFASENTLRNLTKNGFQWIWEGTQPGSHMTLHGDRMFPPACFDHIFYRGLTLRKAEVLNTTRNSSDHKPIVASFNLPSP
ncbi:MAG TPA: endonuclease/exonuclease/phosphatase family protein [Chthoniobacterales bacterium]|nr:endonuclease/exonuclease/phosphatase family protein [Chthoniobacterales bacterium]